MAQEPPWIMYITIQNHRYGTCYLTHRGSLWYKYTWTVKATVWYHRPQYQVPITSCRKHVWYYFRGRRYGASYLKRFLMAQI